MIDWNELQIYSEVCEARSFTVAAERLGVPKSSVSRGIQSLERRLGMRLLDRTTRSVQLTEAGQIYLERCRHMSEEAQQADAEIAGLCGVPRGRLRIGAPGAFIQTVLASVLADFVLAYPELRIQVQQLQPATLRERRCDVVIVNGPLDSSRLFISPVLRLRVGLYASPRYLTGRQLPQIPSDLREHRCLTKNCGLTGEPADEVTWRLRRGSEEGDVRVASHVAVPDPAIGQRLILGGAGIGLVPQFAARNELAKGSLVRILPEWEPEPVELYALYSSRLSASPKVRAFLDFLRASFDATRLLEEDGTSGNRVSETTVAIAAPSRLAHHSEAVRR